MGGDGGPQVCPQDHPDGLAKAHHPGVHQAHHDHRGSGGGLDSCGDGCPQKGPPKGTSRQAVQQPREPVPGDPRQAAPKEGHPVKKKGHSAKEAKKAEKIHGQPSPAGKIS